MCFLLGQTKNWFRTQYVYEVLLNQGCFPSFLLENASAEAKIRSFVMPHTKNGQGFAFWCAFGSAKLQVVIINELKVVVLLYLEYK